MTQRERILGALEERGPDGVHSFEFYKNGMPRGAAVIHQLRKAGYDISATEEVYRGESKGVRYVLHGNGPATLPAPSPIRRAPSAYDPWSEAA